MCVRERDRKVYFKDSKKFSFYTNCKHGDKTQIHTLTNFDDLKLLLNTIITNIY